jgi:hypothetical protein
VFARRFERDLSLGYLIDNKYGIMWQDTRENSTIKTNWNNAKSYCES